ncbi:putative colanic acid biosysnthesis UDP-glucose lipid carrier transferase [Flaviramulus basaltis]|uniref:Putative colanic acid biosysnthesis UDP-glucose lipid carrier transferase n=1 Tax=Flaviramulus basaltis TaxID=369401 RepID=A0A1K2ICU9_9FLAO|nr:exopolysaccharide biosynthesis polyprenyl glycosylphosphotransferase [Flaviramulus basaltis]SFZ90112.1 putative colanic acid biosysnthesis UDP-glucose lipid carrier transferase [Flaviramulus basaltis]
MVSKGGHAKLIRPLLYILDLFIISFSAYFFLTSKIIDLVFFIIFWIFLSIFFSFYKVYRFTKIIKIVSLLTSQCFVFLLLIFSYLYIKHIDISHNLVFKFSINLYFVFILWRIILHIIFKKYRIITGSNYKQVIIIGANESTQKLEKFFKNEPGFGYKFMGLFTNDESTNKSGNILDSFNYILENNIDEIYCSVKELSNKQIKRYIEFCDVNVKTLKFIPDNKELYSKNFYLNYYDITPILSLREIPLDDPLNSVIKRVFDVLFSGIIIIFVLSWLIPILGLIIILESKGPIFFQQNRPGIKEKGFGCYKFRSMTINSSSEISATRNDSRITKVGRFIRRTSIDELPQFFNVFFGSMSVVGPRPHLWRQNEIYGPKVPKYMVRHFVKPGVTGLAQVRGYRGEIETKEDIVNRTKYDIFYIENWSLILDLGIIFQTVLNVFKGEEKAY